VWLRGGTKNYKWDSESSTLSVPCAENFENLLLKTQLGVSWVLKEMNPDFIIRTNNSSFWELELAMANVLSLPRTSTYAGVLVKRGRASDSLGLEKSRAFVSGAGMYLSRDCAHFITEHDSNMFAGLNDDVAIGAILSGPGSPVLAPIELSRCDLTDYQVYIRSAHTRVKHWSRGRVTVRRMIRLHELSEIHGLRDLRKWAQRFNFEELLTEGVDPARSVRSKIMALKNFNWRRNQLINNVSERLELA
jgi:hypothetical protein